MGKRLDNGLGREQQRDQLQQHQQQPKEQQRHPQHPWIQQTLGDWCRGGGEDGADSGTGTAADGGIDIGIDVADGVVKYSLTTGEGADPGAGVAVDAGTSLDPVAATGAGINTYSGVRVPGEELAGPAPAAQTGTMNDSRDWYHVYSRK